MTQITYNTPSWAVSDLQSPPPRALRALSNHKLTFHYSSDFRQLRMSSPALKRRNLSLKRRKSTIKVDENDGMFETECETEEVDDDLPATQ